MPNIRKSLSNTCTECGNESCQCPVEEQDITLIECNEFVLIHSKTMEYSTQVYWHELEPLIAALQAVLDKRKASA